MSDNRYRQQPPKLVWDPDYGWVDPRDPYYTSAPPTPPIAQQRGPMQPPQTATPRYEPSRYEEPKQQALMSSVVDDENLTLILVESEEEAWKYKPDRYTGDWQYFKIGSGDELIFGVQYYDTDREIPATVRRICKEVSQETVEPKKSPVEEYLLSLQTQISEIKEMLIYAKNAPDDMETTNKASRKGSSGPKPAGNNGPSDGGGGEQQ